MVHLDFLTFNAFQEHCHIVWDESKSCAVVDPGNCSDAEFVELISIIKRQGLKPSCIMLTHGHFDHVLGVASLAGHFGNLPVYMHPDDKKTLENNIHFCRNFNVPLPEPFETTDIKEGDVIHVGGLTFEVIETPGHTPGGVCYLERQEKVLFSGDTLFAGAIGRTDHPGGDYDRIMESIFTKLLHLEGDIKVIPGHGPTTDIATERMTNPFLMPFNEPYEE
ncbi:MAG: MBL fold metallo-hydrolase [Bacteroidales bacterium]|nr:MBL fold metallo-hydrolase [Bacteroidales bacterium]